MKIAILGTENSHAYAFAKLIKEEEKYADIEIVGVYGYDEEANKKLLDDGLVTRIGKTYDEFVDEVDAIAVTARHGDHHYEYALPYVKKGIHAFIDKPFTVDLNKAAELIEVAKENNALLCGGSSLKFMDDLKPVKRYFDLAREDGDFSAGEVSAPVSMVNEYGGFYFYSQHLVELVITIFGEDIKKVYAYCPNTTVDRLSCVFDYGDYLVTGQFHDSYHYTATAISKKGTKSMSASSIGYCYQFELDELFDMVRSSKMPMTYDRLVLPLKILHAIEDSYTSKKEIEIK